MTTCLNLNLWTWPLANTFSCWLLRKADRSFCLFCSFALQTDKWFLFVLWQNRRCDQYSPGMMSRIWRYSLWMRNHYPKKKNTFWGKRRKGVKAYWFLFFSVSEIATGATIEKKNALCAKKYRKACLQTVIRSNAPAFKYCLSWKRVTAQFFFRVFCNFTYYFCFS